jgi:hypothetical protein
MQAARHLGGAREYLSGGRGYAPDLRDWLRLVGGLAFAIGALVLFIRKSGGVQGSEDWAGFPLFLVLAVPVVLLYGLGARARARAGAGAGRGGLHDHPQPWQAVLLLTAVLLYPVALFQLVDTLGGDTANTLHQIWIWGSMAALAGYAAFVLGATYQALVASLALAFAWLALWDKILGDPSVSTFRVLLFIAAIALIAGSVALRRSGRSQAPELITAAGILGVLAGLLGAFEPIGELTGGLFGGTVEGDGQSPLWDAVVLGVSVALVGYGARVGARGPAYVGAIGLLSFALLVGLELGGLLEGDVDGKLVGWPLLLLLGGGAALAAGVALPPPGQGRGVRNAPEPTRPMEGAAPAPPDR